MKLRYRIKNIFRIIVRYIKGIKWVCDNCGNTEHYEREIWCWKCGKGQMLYKGPIKY